MISKLKRCTVEQIIASSGSKKYVCNLHGTSHYGSFKDKGPLQRIICIWNGKIQPCFASNMELFYKICAKNMFILCSEK